MLSLVILHGSQGSTRVIVIASQPLLVQLDKYNELLPFERYIYNGKEIAPEDTGISLSMKENDIIHAFMVIHNNLINPNYQINLNLINTNKF